MSNIRQITNGISGAEAATIIYDNDLSLSDRITACEDSLETNKAYAAQVSGAGKTNISVTSILGDSVTDVISQSGVTNQVNIINDKIDRMVMISPDDIDDNITDGPVTEIVNADYALKAATDMDGNVLSGYKYEIDALKARVLALEEKIRNL